MVSKHVEELQRIAKENTSNRNEAKANALPETLPKTLGKRLNDQQQKAIRWKMTGD